jgi:hypothetical protein
MPDFSEIDFFDSLVRRLLLQDEAIIAALPHRAPHKRPPHWESKPKPEMPLSWITMDERGVELGHDADPQ